MTSSGSAAERMRDDAPIQVTRPGTGAMLGDYCIVRSLGSGGMGQVFAARRTGSDEVVALKQVAVSDPTLLYRFKQEFRSLADLPHPNLVRLDELVLLPGEIAFFTMELVEGQPLARWVRRGTPAGTLPNLHRLCHALRQLAAGVAHLHRAARVHRDLKSSNVLVSAAGRVVILDFGLIYELHEDRGRITATGQLVGTPAYMAPEQINQRTIGTGVDLYAIGVNLFECLTGCLPFGGSASTVLVNKQQRPAPDPRELVPGTPDWLAQLCRALLDLDPQLRPSAEHVIELLDRNVEAAPLPITTELPGPRLIGRERELAALERAHREVAEVGTTVVHLTGPTGRGKSALIERLLSSHAAAEAGPVTLGDESSDEPEVVLRARCHPRESVPHKGLDSVADALARHLRALPPVDAAALRPRHVRELCELFPILRGVWAEPRRLAIEHEPVTRRRLGVAALREVLARIADTSPLIVVIDDLHWGDLDGLELLVELLSPQREAPPALLLLLAYDDQTATAPEIAKLAGARKLELALPPLAADDARTLASTLLDPLMVDDVEQAATALAEHSQGEPLTIVRGAATQTGGEALAAEDELLQRIRELDPQARRLLELATVAGVQLPNNLAREILASECASFEVAACDLVMAGLLGAVALDSNGVIKLARPRVGELVRVELDDGRRQRLHLELAEVLATRDADPELIAEHFERGGDCARARPQLTLAADHAAEALAFVRAKRLYQRALELLPADIGDEHKTERRALQLAVATQLAHIAQAPECALAHESLVAAALDEASQLRLRAAEDYAVAAWSQLALPSLRELMAEVGEWLPNTGLGALTALVVNSLRLRLRVARHGRPSAHARGTPSSPADEAALESFDLIHATSLALGRRRTLLAAALRPRVMELALALGDPLRLVVALHSEVAWLCASGKLPQAERCLREARQVANTTHDDLIQAHVHAAAHTLHAHEGKLEPAALVFRWAIAALDRRPGEHWLYASLYHNHAKLLRQAGAYQRLRELLPRWLTRLRGFGRRSDIAALVSEQVIVLAQLGERRRARRLLDDTRAGLRADAYELAHGLLADAELWLLRVEGEPDAALELARRTERETRRTGLARSRVALARLLASRLRAELAVAISTGDPRAAPAAPELRRLRRLGTTEAVTAAMILAAGRASLLGQTERELARWRAALAHCERHHLHVLAAAIRWRLIELGVSDIDTLEAEAHAYFLAERIDEIERFVDLVAPALRSAQPS